MDLNTTFNFLESLGKGTLIALAIGTAALIAYIVAASKKAKGDTNSSSAPKEDPKGDADAEDTTSDNSEGGE